MSAPSIIQDEEEREEVGARQEWPSLVAPTQTVIPQLVDTGLALITSGDAYSAVPCSRVLIRNEVFYGANLSNESPVSSIFSGVRCECISFGRE
jgi:hypothetical protein